MKTTAVFQTEAGACKVEKQSEQLYRIVTDGGVQGYLERVDKVWVTLRGPRLDRCVEIGQSLTLERATALLVPGR
jgi:hypothetical protein